MSVIFKKTILTQSITLISMLATAQSYAAQPTSVVELPIITVQATRDVENLPTILSSKAATKLDLTLKQTPQAVSVITAKQIQNQQISTMADALEQVPGVYQRRYGAVGAMGVRGESSMFYARGTPITNISIDGIASSAAVDNQMGLSVAKLNPAIYEKITVVKGVNVLSTGAGNPSASIDLSRKLATAMQPTGQLNLSANSFDHAWGGFRETLDLQSPLNADKTIRGRSVIAYNQQNSFMHWGESQTGLFYGTLAIDPTPETQINLGAMYQKGDQDGLSVYGQTLFANGLKSTTSPRDNAAPRWTYNHTETSNAFVDIKHHFENGWHLNFNYNYLKQNTDAVWGGIAYSAQTANYAQHRGAVYAGMKQLSAVSHGVDLSANRNYGLWGRQHDFVVGASYQSFNSNDVYSYTVGKDWVDLNTWNGHVAVPSDLKTGHRAITLTNTSQHGVFAATRLNLLDTVHAILGLRLSSYDILSLENGEVGHDFSGHNVVTPYAGLIVDLNQNISAYASYSNIFRPQTAQKLDKSPIGPLEGNSYEVGVKASLNEDRLNLSAAYFESHLENSLEFQGRRPNGYAYYRAVKGAITSGFELEALGQLTPALSLQAAYTQATTLDKGKRINLEIPKQMFKLHTLYQLPASLSQWRIGGGLRWQSDIFDATKTGAAYVAHQQKAFAVADLLLKYQMNADTSLGLNINNIGNCHYRTNVLQSTYADPRSYILSLNYRF